MPYPIIRRTDLSLAELMRINRSGGSVMRSNHVGNVYLSNLVVGLCGIPLNCYDRTVGELDHNYHPERVIVHGHSEPLANKTVLMTHAKVEQTPTRFADRFPIGARVAECHTKALADALPGGTVYTYTDYLRKHAYIALEILEIVTRSHPYLWERTVNEHGRTSMHRPQNWKEITRAGIFGITNDREGWIPSNEMNILFDGICEHLTLGVPEMYHLSGPDMVRYVGKLQGTLNILYEEVRRHFSRPLPETLPMYIVPIADMRFAAPEYERGTLFALVEAWFALDLYTREKRSRFATVAGEEKKALIESFKERHQSVHRRLTEAANACSSIFYQIAHGDAFSQYDILAGNTLTIHPWMLETPIGIVSTAFEICERARHSRMN